MTRRPAAIALGITIALGLVSRRVHLGVHLWDKSLGDALYTVMLYCLVTLARPNRSPTARGAMALAISVVVELFQLTGIPRRLPRVLQIALGTTFAWHDVACYVAGAAAAALGEYLLRRRRG